MKPVIIIAIALVLLVGLVIPVMAEHEPNYVEEWHEACKTTHERNMYVQGHSSDALDQQYQECVAKISYPPTPLTSKDCKAYYDQEYGKLQRALEVGQISQDNEDANTEYLEKGLQKCYDNAVTPKQQKCYVQLASITNHEDNLSRDIDNDDNIASKGMQEYYDNALTKYNHCMGVKPDSLSKDPVYKTSVQIIKDEAHRQCEEQWESQQGYMPCIEEHSSDIEPYIADKCDEMKPYDVEEWYLTGTTFDQWNQCQIDAGTVLYQSQPEPVSEPEILEEVEIVCGKGTVLIDYICQVDKTEEKEKEIPVEEPVDTPVEKAVDTPVEKPAKKSVNWFSSLFDWFGGLFK